MKIFAKLKFLNDKIYRYSKNAIWHLAIWHGKIGVSVNCINQELKFCVSFYIERKILGNKRTYFPENPGNIVSIPSLVA